MTIAVIKYRPPTSSHKAHRETSFSQDHMNPHIYHICDYNYVTIPQLWVYIPTLTLFYRIKTVAVSISHLQAVTRPTVKLASLRILWTHITYLCVTGFVKINPSCTRTEICFIAEHIKANSCTNQKHQIHGYRWQSLLSQNAFCHPCQITKVHYRVLGPVNGTNKDGVLPDCCQPLSWLIL